MHLSFRQRTASADMRGLLRYRLASMPLDVRSSSISNHPADSRSFKTTPAAPHHKQSQLITPHCKHKTSTGIQAAYSLDLDSRRSRSSQPGSPNTKQRRPRPPSIRCTMLRGTRQTVSAHAARDLLAAEGPLDEQQQQAIIRELQEQQLVQNRQFKLVFGVVAALIAAFFAWAAHRQHVAPWEQRFTGELRTVTGQHTVTLVLLLQAISMAWAASALLTDVPQRGDRTRGCSAAGLATQAQLTASVACAATAAWYWGHAMHANIKLHGPKLGAAWDLLWLPLGPLAYSCLCVYVVVMLSSTGREVQQLQRLAYQYKTV